jgi:hypothetical protein
MEEEISTEVAAVEETQVEPAEEVSEEPVVEKIPEVVEKPPEPRRQTAQERIDEITKARREAEREREYWKRVALEKETTTPEPKVEAPLVPPRPTLDQYDTTTEYEDALFDWNDKRKEIVSRAEKQKVQYEEALNTFQQRAEAVRKEYDDFDEVVEAPVFSTVMRTALLHSDNGPLVAYHLGRPENKALADKIRSMPTEMQPYELGKLESQLLLAKQNKKVSAAPPPIKPVGMGGSPAIDESTMSDDEWFKLERQRTKDKLKQKYGG